LFVKLILMRHGEALHPAVDPQMRLSPRGQRDAVKMGEYLKSIGLVIDAVWHSPKARALETAQTVASALGLDPAILQQHPELVPEGDVVGTKDRIEWVRKAGVCQGLLIVSHMPFLPQLTARLTGDVSGTDFDTASAACFLFLDGVWTREWFQEPARL
jgi:phosphohistidine phosphatase